MQQSSSGLVNVLPRGKAEWNGHSRNPRCACGCAQLSSGFEGVMCFQRTPFSFDLLGLFMLVCWSWVPALVWRWHFYPAWIKSLLLRAAWPGWAVTGCPQCRDCAMISASSPQCARAGRAAGLLCPCEHKSTLLHRQHWLLMNCFSLFCF